MSSACSSTSETLLIIRQGGDHLSMARGGIYTADLAAKGRRIKWGRKKKSSKEKGKQSAALKPHAICHHKHCHVLRWSLSVCVGPFFGPSIRGQNRGVIILYYQHQHSFSLYLCVWRLGWWAVGLCAHASEGAGICQLLDGGEQCRSVTPANLGQGYWDSGGIHHCGSLETQTGGKATEVAGGGKKPSKNLMHSAERSCHTWLWKIIPDACSAKMEL